MNTKLTILLVLFLNAIFNTASYAQVFKKALPKAGSFSYACRSNQKYESYITYPDKNNNYDFSFLQSYWSIKERYLAAKDGKYAANFKLAQLVHQKANNEEEYLSINNDLLVSHGKAMESTFTKNNLLIERYRPERTIFSVKDLLTEGYKSEYTITYLFSKNNMTFVSLLPIGYDSLKIEVAVKEVVISKGNLSTLEFNTTKYGKVRRYESTIISSINAKVKKGRTSKWEDYTAIAYLSFPEPIRKWAKSSLHKEVFFISTESYGQILSYEVNNDKIEGFVFQDRDLNPQSFNFNHDELQIIATPNPTFGPIDFEIFNHPFGNYRLEIYNLVGKKLYTKYFSERDERTLKADISTLRRGTYLYSIFDGAGKKLATKRIVLMDL